MIESAQLEQLTEEQVNDIIDEFVDQMWALDEQLFNEIENTYADYPTLMFGGHPEDGFDLQYAEKLIQPLIPMLHGWSLSKRLVSDYDGQTLIYFGWLPDKGDRVSIPEIVYHISPEKHLTSISQNGIKASKGGTRHFIHVISKSSRD